MSEPPIRVGLGGVTPGPDCDAVTARFQADGLVALPGLLDAGFMALLDRTAPHCHFVRETVPDLGEWEIERPTRLARAVLLGLKHNRFLDWVRAITGVPAISEVGGNVVRAWPGGSDQLDWHDDNMIGRVAGLSIRLGMEGYTGGDFELRAKRRPDEIHRFHHARPGDALLFRVSPKVEHRVLPLISGGPRFMFAGWFLTAA